MRSGPSRRPVWVAVLALLTAGCGADPRRPAVSPQREIMARYNLARVYLEQGKVQESIQELDKLLKEEPKHAEAHNLLGLVYLSISQRDQARAEFERALDLNPYLSDARVNLGVVYSEQKDYTRAETEFRRVLEDRTYAAPEKPLTNLAINLLKQEHPRQAMREAQEAIRRNPRYARAYEIFLQAMGKSDPADASAEYRALERELAGSIDFHLNLAEAFLKENDRRRARAHLQKVVALDPKSEQAGRARQALEKLP